MGGCEGQGQCLLIKIQVLTSYGAGDGEYKGLDSSPATFAFGGNVWYLGLWEQVYVST